jgi:hypothetical protein
VDINANSGFADNSQGLPPNQSQPYPFPSSLVSCSIGSGLDEVTLADLISRSAQPISIDDYGPSWTFDLDADPSAGSATLSFLFEDGEESFEFYGLTTDDQIGTAYLSTAEDGTIYLNADFLRGPEEFTGILTADPTPAPEPWSLALLLSSLGMLGIAGAGRRCQASSSAAKDIKT